MTVPDLVEVIQSAMLAHAADWEASGDYGEHAWLECKCGETWDVKDEAAAHLAHQARAVLDALTEAGTVEWGVAWKGAGPSGVLAFDSEEDAREAVELGGLLSRLTLPWGRAE